jgi:succinate dehydrogenase / fumarate reductase cytochrome b subunit
MSSIAVDSRVDRTARFYNSTIGKKAIMAVTGLILFGFVIGHLAGNLQIYEGPEVMNRYAVFLRSMPAVLWGARIVLLLSVILHIVAAIQLAALKNEARPVSYVKKNNAHSSYASRTMYWSGPILAAFIIYHLLHFTFGTVHPDFQELHPYENVVNGFRVIPVSIAYIVAMILLGMHLYHGAWSMFQSVGLSHPKYTPMLKRFAALAATLIVIGNISIPISVMAGIVK